MSSTTENGVRSSVTESAAKYVPVLMPIESIGEMEKNSDSQSNPNSQQPNMNIPSQQSISCNTKQTNEKTCYLSVYERFERACESCFQIKERGSSTSQEIFLGSRNMFYYIL